MAAWHFAFSGELAGFEDDGPIYLLMAQVFGWTDSASVAVREAYAYRALPPAFPAVLALTGAVDAATAHGLVLLQWSLALVLLYLFYLRHCLRAWHALVLLALYCTLPGWWLSLLPIGAEAQYLLISLLLLLLVDGRTPRGGLALPLGFLFAALILTRTVGVALLAAWMLHLLLARRLRRPWPWLGVVLFLFGLMTPLLGWGLLKPAGSAVYVADLFRLLDDPEPFMRLIVTARNMTLGLVHGWGEHFLLFWPAQLTVQTILLAGLGLLALLGLLLRLSAVDTLYCLLYVGILLVWPYPQEGPRFLLPILPLAVLSIYMALNWLTRRARAGAVAVALAGFMFIALTVPATSFIYHRHRYAVEQVPELAHLLPMYTESDLSEAVGSVTVMGSAVFSRYYIELLGSLDLGEHCPGKVLALKPQMLTWLSGIYAENLPILTRRAQEEFLDEVRLSGATCVLVTRVATVSVLPGLGLVQVLSPIAEPVQAGRLPGTEVVTYVVMKLREGSQAIAIPGQERSGE